MIEKIKENIENYQRIVHYWKMIILYIKKKQTEILKLKNTLADFISTLDTARDKFSELETG